MMGRDDGQIRALTFTEELCYMPVASDLADGDFLHGVVDGFEPPFGLLGAGVRHCGLVGMNAA